MDSLLESEIAIVGGLCGRRGGRAERPRCPQGVLLRAGPHNYAQCPY